MREHPFNVVAVAPGGVAGLVALMQQGMGVRAERVESDLFALWLPAPYEDEAVASDGSAMTRLRGFPNEAVNAIVNVPTPELFEQMKALGVPMALVRNDVWDEAIATYIPPAT